MNNDLISRSALKKVFTEECCGCCDNCSHCMTGYKCELIDNAPTVEPVPVHITHTTVTPVKVNAIGLFPKRSVTHGWIDDTQIKTKLVEIMKTELIKYVQIVEVQEREFDDLQYWGMIEVLPNEQREYLNHIFKSMSNGSEYNQDNKGGNT